MRGVLGVRCRVAGIDLMGLGPGVVEDHRGQPIALAGVREVQRRAIDLPRLQPVVDTLAAIWMETVPTKARVALFVPLFLLLSATAWLGFWERMGIYLLVGVAAVLMIRFVFRVRFREARAAQRDVLVCAGLCAGCGYSLTGLAPQHDGVVECPECDAAWLADRVQRHVLDAGPLPGTPRSGLEVWLGRSRAFGRKRILDDRGDSYAMVQPRVLRARLRRSTGKARRKYQLLLRQLESKGLAIRVLLAAMFFLQAVNVPLLFILAVAPALPPVVGRVAPIGAIVFAIVMILVALSALQSDVGRSARFVLERALRVRLCAACGADLEGAAGDGSCPDCGAAWSVGPERDESVVER